MFWFFKPKSTRGNKARATHTKRGLGLETLESRQLTAVDLGDQIPRAALYAPEVAGQMPTAGGPTLKMNASAASVAPDLFLTPDVIDALEEVRMGRATNRQRALVFVHNEVINKARLNGWITDAHYQSAQADFKSLNDNFAGRAARDAGNEFGVQVSKKSGFSPGTDSDYIIKVKSHDPVGSVKSMQRMYNTNVNQWLDHMMGAEQAKAYQAQNWQNRLDVDFMVDPKYVTDEQFKQIAELNNDAYKRRLAADYERVSRTPAPERVTDAHFRDYALEMQDFIKKKQDLMAKIRANPDLLRTSGPEMHRLMAQEQKYIDRVESANKVLRTQEKLPQAKPPHPDAHYEVINKNGEVTLKHRSSETIAARGAVRSPQNLRMTTTASSLAPLTAQQAMANLSESMVEANVKNAKTAPPGSVVRNLADVGQDVGKMMASLPDAEKGRFIDTIRRQHGDKVAAKIVEGMKREYGAPAAGGTALDNTLKNALSISDDVRGMGNVRRVFNESLGKVMKIVGKVGTLGDLVMIKDALVDFKNIMTYIGEALVPSRTDAEADQLFRRAMTSSHSMIETGAMGMLFARVPTLGAIYGAWTLGFDGTRYVLENTKIGQRLERFKDQYGDRMLAAYDTAMGQLTEFLGGTSAETTQREQLLAIETNLLRMLREGKAVLRDGVKGLDVLNRIRSGDLVGLDELVKFSGRKLTNGPITVTDHGWVRDTVNPAFARPMTMIGIGGSLGAGTQELSYSLTLKKHDELLPNFKYDGAASPGAFVTLSWYFTDDKGQGMPSNPPGSPYKKAWADGTYILHVTPGNYIDTNWGPHGPNPNWSIPFTMDIRVLGATVRIGDPRPMTSGDWSTEIARLNAMTPTDAGKAILAFDIARQLETFELLNSLRASQILWTYNWQTMTSLLDKMPADRVTEILSNYSPTNRTAALDQMTAKRAGEVIKGYDLWPDRIAALDKMTAKRAADVIWTYAPHERTDFLDHMTGKRASEVIWNYGWTDRIAELDRMTSKRASEVIWNYSPTDRTATLDRMTSKRASEVIWNYNWTNLTASLDSMTSKRASEIIWNYNWANMIASLDRMTSKRASDVIWNYSWANMIATLDRMTARRAAEVIWNYSVTNRTATFDRMTAQRAAQVISQYNSTAKADVLSRFTPARRSEIAKFL